MCEAGERNFIDLVSCCLKDEVVKLSGSFPKVSLEVQRVNEIPYAVL